MIFFPYLKSKSNLQKGTHSCKKAHLQQVGFFVNLRPVAEGGQRHPALLRRGCTCDCPSFPLLVGTVVVLREWSGWSAEPHTPRFRRRNALRLPLADIGALVFRHKRQHLEYYVAEKGAHQVLAAPSVQERHIQHHNINTFLLGQNPPLLQNLPIVPPQTVDALNIEQIVFFYTIS